MTPQTPKPPMEPTASGGGEGSPRGVGTATA